MKETKKVPCHFSFYDQVRIQEKLEEMAEEDGVFLPIKSNIRASYVLLAFSTLLILFAFGSSLEHLIFGLVWSGIMCIITFSVNVIKKKLKQNGVSRWANRL